MPRAIMALRLCSRFSTVVYDFRLGPKQWLDVQHASTFHETGCNAASDSATRCNTAFDSAMRCNAASYNVLQRSAIVAP